MNEEEKTKRIRKRAIEDLENYTMGDAYESLKQDFDIILDCLKDYNINTNKIEEKMDKVFDSLNLVDDELGYIEEKYN